MSKGRQCGRVSLPLANAGKSRASDVPTYVGSSSCNGKPQQHPSASLKQAQALNLRGQLRFRSRCIVSSLIVVTASSSISVLVRVHRVQPVRVRVNWTVQQFYGIPGEETACFQKAIFFTHTPRFQSHRSLDSALIILNENVGSYVDQLAAASVRPCYAF